MPNLREHVHVRLRVEIIAGRIRDGERLNERELASGLGVSTTPLKEALRQLEAEGLVRIEPRRGIIVTFGWRQAEEMSLARAALESMIARLAAKRASPADILKVGAALPAMEAATLAGDVERLIELNERFHTEIHAASGCEYLPRLQGRQQMYDRAIRCLVLGNREHRRLTHEEHCAIADAIAQGDPDTAERRMRDHVVRSGGRHIVLAFPDASDMPA
jgi:DNA-binding GntR family transcriptional regulator